ncbi:hypothetical protein G5B38_11115 [Pseudohalocynthiibacter aestuariivivens]|uniref:AcrB/AcrD/AcrF family protein n=1 Tax=Roseovarius pelagicus TaxID=2980108 RepID=A0ABY6D793_9RHOB|nr:MULTISPECIES: hypothetical protein [Rhodobacterales]QIE46029.1 hypothetical protein G5B38_11115 [Pseudohalocynthiibacter aestuariivivens]UXX82012.1 hypothetical protein N7U68_12900 [Roseovarius pelagicus]
MDRISLKPALLARRVSYEIAPTYVAQYAKDGTENWRTDFGDLTSLNFVLHTIGGNRMRRLDLVTNEGRKSIALNLGIRVGRDDPDRVAIRQVHSAVADAVYAARPDIQVALGEQGAARIAMFVVGVMTLLFGIGMCIAMFVTNVSMDRAVGVAVPIGLMVVLGGFFAHKYAPWREAVTLSIQAFAVMMAADAASPPVPSA